MNWSETPTIVKRPINELKSPEEKFPQSKNFQSNLLTKPFKRMVSNAGSKNYVLSSPRVKLTQGLYAQTFSSNFGLSAIVYEL